MIPLMLAATLVGQAGKPLVVGDVLPDIQVQSIDATWISLVDHLNHKPTVLLRSGLPTPKVVDGLEKASTGLLKMGYLSVVLTDKPFGKLPKSLDRLMVSTVRLAKYFPDSSPSKSVLYIIDSSAEVREVDAWDERPLTCAQIIRAAKDAL